MRSVEFVTNAVLLIDQTRLPHQLTHRACHSVDEVAAAIREMVVRGAPAIGVAAAGGLALAARASTAPDGQALVADLQVAADRLAATRPTAVNLRWALERQLNVAHEHAPRGVAAVQAALAAEAVAIGNEGEATNRRIGRHGAELVPDGAGILTHCNAGALATAGYGTALGVIRAAAETKTVHVFAGETRPRLQGARLTAWELLQAGIPSTLITDGMAGHFMRAGRIQLVIVGADRIAANGDTANKIGTYQLAVLAHHHTLPFYVAAPLSTLDPSLAHGDQIPIEERAADEVAVIEGQRITPVGTTIANPAFDVTPADLITAIVTEVGLLRPPFAPAIRSAMAGAGAFTRSAGGPR